MRMQLHPRTISRILELNNWFGTMMANLQLRSLQYATGPGSLRFFKYVHQPQNRDEQEMHSSDHSSKRLRILQRTWSCHHLRCGWPDHRLELVTEGCCEQNTTGHAEGAIPHQEVGHQRHSKTSTPSIPTSWR